MSAREAIVAEIKHLTDPQEYLLPSREVEQEVLDLLDRGLSQKKLRPTSVPVGLNSKESAFYAGRVRVTNRSRFALQTLLLIPL